MSNKSRKGNYPKYVYSATGQLYKMAHSSDEESSSSEEEQQIQSKKQRQYKKQSKYAHADSESDDSSSDESDEEIQQQATKKGKSSPQKSVKKSPAKKSPIPSKKSKVSPAESDKVSKKSAKKATAGKRKRSNDTEGGASLEEVEEDPDTDPDEASHARLAKAEKELLTEEQMKAKTEKENEKRYRASKKFIDWYTKEYKSVDSKELEPWQKADKLMTEAAANIPKLTTYHTSDKVQSGGVAKVIPGLERSSREKYAKAIQIIEELSEEDKAKFWEKQERNKHATKFEDLITIKEFNKRNAQKVKEFERQLAEQQS